MTLNSNRSTSQQTESSETTVPLDTHAFNTEQQTVVRATGGYHLVLAPPGCGKTAVLAERIAWAHSQGVDYSDMACLTFTNRAARGMRERILQRLGDSEGLDQLFIGNVHRFCSHFLFHENIVPEHTTVIDTDTSISILTDYMGEEELKVLAEAKHRQRYSQIINLQHLMHQCEHQYPGKLMVHRDALPPAALKELCIAFNLDYSQKSTIDLYRHADRYIDVVGTGGDRKNTFNISTTSCFVIAGAGYKVAKHGNYAATSTSGASNVIAQHGVTFTADIDRLNRSLNEAGIVYLHAQLFAKAMKFVGPIRKALQFPTIFNLLGPLVNPSQPQCQLLGVATLDQMRLYSNVYQKIGIDYCIVNSIDGYDEISLTGDFKVTTNDYERVFSPSDLGFDIAKPEELVGGATEEEAAAIFDAVLENRALPAQKNIVLANAAFGIQVLEKGKKDIDECIAIARESIDSGSALRTFKKFVELNS